jgi:transaldolase
MQEMKENPLIGLKKAGVSVWLDYLSRAMIKSGELRRLIQDDGIAGVTSNPTIFQKAFSGSPDYDEKLKGLLKEGVREERELLIRLASWDVSEAADILRPVYDSSKGVDGYVSIEVAPDLAFDTEKTIAEAKRLFNGIGKKNIYIKVPATKQGLPAIERLTAQGLNVNVTLLFGRDRYDEVMDAYMKGLERRLKDGKPIEGVSSVASFFVSRVDVLVDKLLDEKMPSLPEARKDKARGLMGKAAVANAKLAYRQYRETFEDRRFLKLGEKGARIQRLLWGSTSTKNPEYSDIKYVEELTGPDIINTMPEETAKAYKDHGEPRRTIDKGLKEAEQVFTDLKELGIDFRGVTDQLEEEGVRKFSDSYFSALKEIAGKREALLEKAPR